MIKNLSYNDPKINQFVIEQVGRPFSFFERIKLGGIGLGRLPIEKCSREIEQLIDLDNYTNYCNFELRPKGIVLRFRSLLETYGLIIPYYKLSIIKSSPQIYTLHIDHHFVSVRIRQKKFVAKILSSKLEFDKRFEKL